ncbi:hypothetical protein SNEBB_004531 [Seison nebaliae]|nr:hypothetical protein SNEBB_004531 [Seison nebaliae]
MTLSETIFNFKDKLLEPYSKEIQRRHKLYQLSLKRIEEIEEIDSFIQSHKIYGIKRNELNGRIFIRLWAPHARQIYVFGDFNQWNKRSHELKKLPFGKWELEFEEMDSMKLKDKSKIKLLVIDNEGNELVRLDPWSCYVKASSSTNSNDYDGIFYEINGKDKRFEWKYENERMKGIERNRNSLRIYEAHIGISSSQPKIASYGDFKENVLPRLKRQGYNTIQLMGIMEHAYYASFGYQVTSPFAASSRYGEPNELKELIDECHRLNIIVLLDLIISHSSSNTNDGLNRFDGSDNCFFHANRRGFHSQWNSRLFNYNDIEVQRYLLSNVHWWLNEYHFDGFRFDGVTSMLYHSHGIDETFGSYPNYFGMNVDVESIIFLMLCHYVGRRTFPQMISIGEDVSGMPTLCLPIDEGGIGFDYRLAMSIPDMWIRLLKHSTDDQWEMGNIIWTLTNRRFDEKCITYCESHDQALVGDKTLAFWLMDKFMYTNMSVMESPSIEIDRGIALHKLIRLLTFGLGGNGWLNFMGNEFGHPEWLDFPRKGNNESYHYCRRQWNLVDNELLRYKFLNKFDECMLNVEEEFQFFNDENREFISRKDENDKVIVFERGSLRNSRLIWCFNFHPNKSYTDYQIGASSSGNFNIILSSDDSKFGGYSRVDTKHNYLAKEGEFDGMKCSLKIYLPSRSAVILKRI